MLRAPSAFEPAESVASNRGFVEVSEGVVG